MRDPRSSPPLERRRIRRPGRLAVVLVALSGAGVPVGPALAGGTSAPDLRTAEAVDLERYAGRWYEIARRPNPFQDHCRGDVVVDYRVRGDGRLDVVNRCRTEDGEIAAEGVARRADAERQDGRLEVRFAPGFLSFLPWVWGDYWILELDPEYRWSVVGEPKRRYLWILARTPDLDEEILSGIVERLAQRGYPLNDLTRTRHGGSAARSGG